MYYIKVLKVIQYFNLFFSIELLANLRKQSKARFDCINFLDRVGARMCKDAIEKSSIFRASSLVR